MRLCGSAFWNSLIQRNWIEFEHEDDGSDGGTL